jgi:hypothetical protein
LEDLEELISSYPGSIKKIGRSAEEFESYVDSITMVNKALNDVIHG